MSLERGCRGEVGRKAGGHEELPSMTFEESAAARSAARFAAAVAVAMRAAVNRFEGERPGGGDAEGAAASAAGAAFRRGVFRSLPASRGSLKTTRFILWLLKVRTVGGAVLGPQPRLWVGGVNGLPAAGFAASCSGGIEGF